MNQVRRRSDWFQILDPVLRMRLPRFEGEPLLPRHFHGAKEMQDGRPGPALILHWVGVREPHHEDLFIDRAA